MTWMFIPRRRVVDSGADPFIGDVSVLWLMTEASGSTTLLDWTANNHDLAVDDGATYTDAQPRYSTGSLVCTSANGAGRIITAQALPGMNFGSADFTLDGWVRKLTADGGGQRHILDTDSQRFMLRSNGAQDKIRWYASNVGGGMVGSGLIDASYTWVDATWVFLSVTRVGNNWYMHADGVKIGESLSSSGTLSSSDCPFQMGNSKNGGDRFGGHIGPWRFTKAARYGSGNYTPPTAAFPTT